jgi:hypothetical protein
MKRFLVESKDKKAYISEWGNKEKLLPLRKMKIMKFQIL